jgi:hypothetical protein
VADRLSESARIAADLRDGGSMMTSPVMRADLDDRLGTAADTHRRPGEVNCCMSSASYVGCRSW